MGEVAGGVRGRAEGRRQSERLEAVGEAVASVAGDSGELGGYRAAAWRTVVVC